MHTNSHFISTKHIEENLKTDRCMCLDCRRSRHEYVIGCTPDCGPHTRKIPVQGISITSSKVKEFEQEAQRIERNRKLLYEGIIDSTWAVCQNCGAKVKLLPEFTEVNARKKHLTNEIKLLKDKIVKCKEEGQTYFANGKSKLESLHNSILWREKEIKEMKPVKIGLEKRICLYKLRSGVFACGPCYDRENPKNV
jgi:hypothetical protein